MMTQEKRQNISVPHDVRRWIGKNKKIGRRLIKNIVSVLTSQKDER